MESSLRAVDYDDGLVLGDLPEHHVILVIATRHDTARLTAEFGA